MATIIGTAGNDTLTGTSGNDTLDGLAGNDVLVGSAGTDRYDGGSGSDTLDLRATSAPMTVSFTSGVVSGSFDATFINMERVLAGNGSDNLIGAGGAQNLSGRAGNDTLAGGTGVDTLWGGSGADRYVFRETGSANADGLGDFASGSDKIVLDAAVMTALGAAGNFSAGDPRFWSSSSGTAHDPDDRVIFNTSTRQVFYDADGNGAGAAALIATLQSGAALAAADIFVEGGAPGEPINGGPGNDSLVGTADDDTINGFGGNDTLEGLAGADTLNGGDGSDLLAGGIGSDLVLGGAGNDTLRDVESVDPGPGGTPDADTLNGGSGNDTYDLRSDPFGDRHAVLVDSGGIDTVLSNHDFVLPAGFENLEIFEGHSAVGNELPNVIRTHTNEPAQYVVHGAGGNDTLIGGPDQDLLHGDAGNDTFVGSAGSDFYDGGAGSDTFDFRAAATGVTLNFAAGTVSGGFDGTFVNMERVLGSNGADSMTGAAGGQNLSGRSGSDTVAGATGIDTLWGGSGDDDFVFREMGNANADRIGDFASGSDDVLLDDSAFTAIGALGSFSSGDARFAAGGGFTSGRDPSDRVIYNTTTGNLYYDADGNGAGAAQLIATLSGSPGVAATDITVI